MTLQAIRQIPGKLLANLKTYLQNPLYMANRRFQAIRHGRALKPSQDHTNRIQPGDVLLFATMRNEGIRIPYFLDYYRRLGVNHFLFVDNDSNDGLEALLAAERDVSLWHTSSSYAAANFGMHWLNHLLHKYGVGHWCVTCDPDEFLVYPHCDTRSLQDLGRFLKSEGRLSFCCLMLDMYNRGSLDQAVYESGQDPLEVSPYFDQSGYSQHLGWLLENATRGGVRRRLFFSDIPDQAPALNKTPFVFWQRSFNYFLSMHQLVPKGLNRVHDPLEDNPTGTLLHFKYFSMLREKVSEEIERGEHWDNSFEYRRYEVQLEQPDLDLSYSGSVKYENWQQLETLGLLHRGGWF